MHKYIMHTGIIICVVLVVLIILYLYKKNYTRAIVYSKNMIPFKVNKNIDYEFMKDSANILDSINSRVYILLTYLQKNYPKNPTTIILVSKYSPNIISESKIKQNYTTYTVDKSLINICIRTRSDDKQDIYDINLLIYVVLHELAHLCNYDSNMQGIIGHGSEFIDKFKFLVESGIKCGIYKYEDYSVQNREYCGIMLSSQILK